MKLRIVLALGIATSVAFADAEPPARPGNRSLSAALEVDQSTLPKDRVLGYARPRKWGRGVDEGAHVMLLVAPLVGENLIFLFVVPRAEANGVHTVDDLRRKGAVPVRLEVPAGELPSSDARVRVKRRARVVSADPLEIEVLEDVFESQSGEALCRVPPLETQIEPGFDPCIKKSRTELLSSFVREHQVWVASGVAGSLLVAGAAWMLVRLRKRPAS